jgi:hypothetical protein
MCSSYGIDTFAHLGPAWQAETRIAAKVRAIGSRAAVIGMRLVRPRPP